MGNIVDELDGLDKAVAIEEPTQDAAASHFWGDFGFDGLSDEVWAERKRQLDKRGVQERPSGTSKKEWGPGLEYARAEYDRGIQNGNLTWLTILREEVYEVFEAETVEQARLELIQVMAVAASWVLDLDRRQTLDAPAGNAAQEALDRTEAVEILGQ